MREGTLVIEGRRRPFYLTHKRRPFVKGGREEAVHQWR